MEPNCKRRVNGYLRQLLEIEAGAQKHWEIMVCYTVKHLSGPPCSVGQREGRRIAFGLTGETELCIVV